MNTEAPKGGNGGNGPSAMAKFLNGLNPTTLIAILVMGGGNLFTTKSTSDEQQAAVREQRAIIVRQVRDLHEALDDFEKRQKLMLDQQNEDLRRSAQILQELHKQP